MGVAANFSRGWRATKQQSAAWGLAARAWGLYAGRMRRWLFFFVLALVVWGCSPKSQGRDGAQGDARLDEILEQLRLAPDARAAAKLEAQAWERFRRCGGPVVEILLERAVLAQTAEKPDRASGFLDDGAKLAPQCAEVWNRKAGLAYQNGDTAGALRAIQEALVREPRHFGALVGLGRVYEELGRESAALLAYESALAVHPFFEPAQRGVARLGGKADGREA